MKDFLDKLECHEFTGIRWIQHGCLGHFMVMRCSPWQLHFLFIQNGEMQTFFSYFIGSSQFQNWEEIGMNRVRQEIININTSCSLTLTTPTRTYTHTLHSVVKALSRELLKDRDCLVFFSVSSVPVKVSA